MQRKTPHFSQTQNRPDPDFSDRPANKAQQAAAEEYARVGLERAFKKSQLEAHQAESGATPLVSKEQLAEYHAAWQDYWNKYYQQYYSEYYNKYHGQVQEVVQTQHRRSYNKIVEMFNDNKKLAEEKKRLEDPEGIRRDLINRVVERGRKSRFWYRVRHHVKGLIFAGFATGIFLFVQFNPVVVGAIKQYLGPSAASSFPSIIDPSSTTEVSKTPTLIIPKIGISVPIVLDERSAENEPVQKALEHGVIRYWKSSDPGQTGNVVILGHSSNNLLSPGDYKYAFVNLRNLEKDDIIYADNNGVRYAYKVTDKQIVPPSEFAHIYPTDVPSITLITCDPPGTSKNRLFVRAIQISPDPANNTLNPLWEESSGANGQPQEVPSAAPSIWNQIF